MIAMKTDQEIIDCRLSATTIREAMKRKHLSRDETASRAHMASRQLARIMDLDNCPSLERAKQLSVVLEVPIEELFEFTIKTRDARQPLRKKGFDKLPMAEK
jgi:transcriptional regulator with XRE-family HTH domain